LQVLWALGGKVEPKEEVVDGCMRQERPWLVLFLRVEDFSEMKPSQRNCWQTRGDCPGETRKEVGVYEETILGCLLSGTRRVPFPMEEMMKPKWSGRVWVGESKQPLSGAQTMPAVRRVSSIICRALETSSKEEQATHKSST
jgi:hypothetical protein